MRDPQSKLIKGGQSLCIFCRPAPGWQPLRLRKPLFTDSPAPNGSVPWQPPVEGLDLFLYGTTESGGASQAGTIYKPTPEGKQAGVRQFLRHRRLPGRRQSVSRTDTELQMRLTTKSAWNQPRREPDSATLADFPLLIRSTHGPTRL